MTTITEYSFALPDDFDDFAWEVQAKGYFSGGLLTIAGKCYRLNFYDPFRLDQEIKDVLQGGGAFFEPNIVVVRSVTKLEMERAAEMLARSSRKNTLVTE